MTRTSPRLPKELGLLQVYAVATGGTVSAGLFILPGLVALDAGPALVLCYLLAVFPLIPPILSLLELSTAMPRAGGPYYFIDRSLGPLFGTVGGIGTWLSLVLKTTVAFVGIGIYLDLVVPDLPAWAAKLAAVSGAALLGALNAAGARSSGSLQIVLVAGLLLLSFGFIAVGLPQVEISRFDGWYRVGPAAILAATGTTFMSYGGLSAVAGIAEEIKDPEKALPRGIFLGLLTAVIVYALATVVIQGVVPMGELRGNMHAPATAANILIGRPGVIAMTIAALLAFFSVGNAGVMSASRYPLAMSRDGLLPPRFGSLAKNGVPRLAVYLTVGTMIAVIVFLDALDIAKLASAFFLIVFAIICAAVIVWRESGIESYDPGYRSPFYPYMHIFGLVIPFVLIGQMGWLPTVFSSAVIAASLMWYFYHAKHRVERRGALFHVFARLGEGRHEGLDCELREILKEKGLRRGDPFDETVLAAIVIDVEEVADFDALIRLASLQLADRLNRPEALFIEGFKEGTATGATPVARGVALPHMRVPDLARSQMVLARTRREIRIHAGDVFGSPMTFEKIHAVFFLVSPEHEPSQHLRLLAQLAQRIDREDFVPEWLAAKNEVRLREVFLRDDRYISLQLQAGDPAHDLIGLALRELELPTGSLVAAIRRDGNTIVPSGMTTLQEGDRMLIIGEPDAIATLYERFTYEPLPTDTDGASKGEGAA